MRIIELNDFGPRTKPKALNVGLGLAQGEITVIFDAEDIPDKDQLRKISTLFHAHSPEVACIQARLNIYNGHKNWISGLFAAEYAQLSGFVLHLLAWLNVPIPLGGTSNFFRTSVLREASGWDPYNVTEDADLGLRLARLGYKTLICDSQTLEEAPTTLKDWLPQRTRWFKGWMQTIIVHGVSIGKFVQEIGISRLFLLCLFVFSLIASAIIHPWFVFALFWQGFSYFFLGSGDPFSFYFLLIGLLGSYIASAASLRFSTWRLHLQINSLFFLAVPLLWILFSWSAYRALYQLIFDPFYWEKTTHYGRSTPMPLTRKNGENRLQGIS